MMEAKRKLFWATGFVVLLLDQLTKLWLWRPTAAERAPSWYMEALDRLQAVVLWQGGGAVQRPVVVVPGVLRVVAHDGNFRGALGLGPAAAGFYVAAAVVGLVLIGAVFVTTPPGRGWTHAALGLLGAGAIGNLIDRAALGFVRDFIDLHWRDAFHWHTFNLADAAICVGFALIVWEVVISRQHAHESPVPGPEGEPGS